jgi:hypothetical protein
MKPVSAEVHEHLADWVKKGGVLVYVGRDDDPYQSVMEWWDTKGNNFKAPSQHLFSLLGINPKGDGKRYEVGKGAVYVLRQNPKEYVMKANKDDKYIKTIKEAYEKDANGGELPFKNSMYLERGPYDVVAVMDENADSKPYTVKGPVIDLFDPQLPVLAEKIINPGEQALLYVVDRVANKNQPKVLATAARVYDEQYTSNSYSFTTKSPINTLNSTRILLPAQPSATVITDSNGQTISDVKTSWDASSHTLYLGFANSPDGIKVNIKW